MKRLISTSSQGAFIFITFMKSIHLAESYALPSPAVYTTNLTINKRQILNNNVNNLEGSLEEQKPRSKREEPRSCIFSRDCHENEWCHNDVCEEPCLKFDCTLVKDGGWCEVVNHQPVCFPEDPPKPKKPTEDCIDSKQCDEDNQFCDHNGKCSHVCPLTLCSDDKPPDGVCVIRNHLPQCAHTDELREGEQVPPSARCVSSSECGEKEWCYKRCENPCPRLHCEDWYDDGYCDVEDHQPVCRIPPQPEITDNYEPPEVLRDKGASSMKEHFHLRSEGEHCTHSYDCKSEFNCRAGKCTNPCKYLKCEALGKNQTRLVFEAVDHKNIFGEKQYKKIELNYNENYKCVVHLHVAKCVKAHTDEPEAFEEAEA